MVDSSESYERTIEAAGVALSSGSPPDIGRAESLYRKALTAGERALGSGDLSLVSALSGLGAALILKGAPEQAEHVLARAITISEQQLGTDHPDFVILLNDLTRLYLKHSAHAYAEPLLLRLLDIKRSKGDDHPEVATVLATLASVRQTLGRYDEAEQMWRHVLDIRERTLAPNHFSTATALEHLGQTCAARGKLREAQQLFQRALVMREATLGKEHASLRASRERIADLQLQASDESLEPADFSAAIPARPRLFTPPIAATLDAPVAPAAPAAASPQPFTAAPVAQPREAASPRYREPAPVAEREPASAKLVVPMSTALTVTEAAPTPAPSSVPYFNVLMDIQDELEEPATAPAPQGKVAAMMAAVALAFRERRPSALIGVGVVVLPLLALGVASAMRSGRGSGWVSQSSSTSSTRADSIAAAALVAEPIRPTLGAAELARDSAAAATRARVAETPSKRQGEERSEAEIVVPRAPVTRLDSVVRSISIPSQNIGEPFQVQLQTSLANSRSATVAELQPTSSGERAKLIGALPTPRYPAGLAQYNIGGKVRVRFDVDTLGRPVMGTFQVISTPHAALSSAVKNVIPVMRFQPARTAGPVQRTITESVELEFNFTPRGDNNDGSADM